MEHLKLLWATMVGWQENFFSSRRSRMAKTVTFWPWLLLFNSFCFGTLSFFPLFPFFPFYYAKKWKGREGVCMAPPTSPLPPLPLGVAGPELPFICFLCCAKKCWVVENIESDVATLKIVTTMQKWYRRRYKLFD